MRKHLIWVLGLALAIGISAVATADMTQQLKVSVGPSKAPKNRYIAGKIHFQTLANSATPGAGQVKAANRVQVFFDNDVKFNPKGIPTCSAATVGNLDTAGARAACPKAIVGKGKATAYLAGDPTIVLNGVITAFNGPPKGKKPTIVLQTRVDAAATTTVITGVLSKQKGDYGNRLDVVVPPAPGGTAIGLFDVTLKKKTGKNQYISVRCGDRNKTLNFKGIFNYSGGEPSKTRSVKQHCSVKN